MPKEYKILAAVAIGAVILGVVLFKFTSTPITHAPLTDRGGVYSLGNPEAPVKVTEFADFQCPACRQANDFSTQLLAAYPNQIQFIFRHFPLTNHPHALISAQAAEAAGAQGKFWEMHDLLYEKQDEWGDLTNLLPRERVFELFKGYARGLGLDEGAFSKAVETNAFAGTIDQDMSAATASGVNSTPSFFVNGQLINEPSYQAIKNAVDKALNK